MTTTLPKVKHSLLKEKRRAYIVLGPEISGTKLLAEILLKCCGLSGQVRDGFLPDEAHDLIMSRWSLPSGLFSSPTASWMKHHKGMVDISSLVKELKKRNYLPVFVGISRSWMAVIRSRISNAKQHGDTRFGPPLHVDTHLAQVRMGISYFYENVPREGYPWYMFNYEEITTNPEIMLPEMAQFLNLEFKGLDKLNWPVKNQNFKWFTDGEKAVREPFEFDSWR